MSKSASTDRLSRTALLKAEDFVTADAAAAELGVSLRTVWRDLGVLRERGLPIDADRGRGGGIRLDRRWGIGRVALDYGEAVDLLISLAIAEQMQSPLFMANLKSVRRQLTSSFAPNMRARVESLKRRILVAQPASIGVLGNFSAASPAIVRSLHQAFLAQERLNIAYRDERANLTERMIEPQMLLLNFPVWYVVGWDHLRDAPRTFRCDRIERAKSTGESFRLRANEVFAEALAGVNDAVA
jgi:predicted DNA-binding transcriptional regulator YafY